MVRRFFVFIFIFIFSFNIFTSLNLNAKTGDVQERLSEYCKNKYSGVDISNALVKFDGVCKGQEVLKNKQTIYYTFMDTINSTLRAVFKIAIFIAILAFLWGSGLYLYSSFDNNKREEAKKVIKGSLIGLALVIFSWYIVDFIMNTLSTSKFSGLKK